MPDEQSVDATLDELFQKFCSVSLIGEPINLKDRIIIPVIKMSITFGGDVGPVAGAVAGLSPVAVLDVKKTVLGQNGVRVLSLASCES